MRHPMSAGIDGGDDVPPARDRRDVVSTLDAGMLRPSADQWRRVFVIYAGLGLLTAIQVWLLALSEGRPVPGWQMLVRQPLGWLSWFATLPLVVALASRAPILRPHRWRALGILVMGAAVLIPLRIVLFHIADALFVQVDSAVLARLPARAWRTLGSRWLADLVHFALLIGGWHVLVLRRALAQETVTQLSLEREVAESTLRELRTRLEPGFISDSLAAIVTTVRDRPEHAEAMVLSLSRFLRRVMAGTRATTSTLKDEVEIAAAYLDLQRLRSRDALTVTIDVSAALDRTPLPAMVLQPMVAEVAASIVGTPMQPAQLQVRARDFGIGLLLVVEGRPLAHARERPAPRFAALGADRTVTAGRGDSHRLSPGRVEVGDELTLTLRLVADPAEADA